MAGDRERGIALEREPRERKGELEREPSSGGRSSSPGPSARKARVLQAACAELGLEVDEAPPHVRDWVNNQLFRGEAASPSPSPSQGHTPSDFARRKVWKTYLFKEPPHFRGYRGPTNARPSIPLVLVHKSFSQLALDLENEKLVLSEEDYTMAEGVYKLFTEGFDDEVTQMNQGELSHLFADYLGAPSIRQVEDVKMDGFMNLSKGHTIVIVFEDKTDDGPNGYLEGLEICRRLFLLRGMQTVSHGILVLRSCPYIIIIALVMDRQENVLLSEPLAHIPFWGPERRTVRQGARALRAMRNFSDSFIPQEYIDVSRPWPVSAWQNLKPLNKDGLVLCGTSESKCKVAKFTQDYSQAAHRAWHQMKLAPELYGCEDLGAGWKFITMQYLSEDEGWRSVAKAPPDHKSLKEFLHKGHETKYVHGDFRPPNLLINGDGAIKAIDFEWSGLEDEDRYPVQLNPELEWEPTARVGELLKKIHDLWQVNKISVDLGASASQVVAAGSGDGIETE